MPWIDFLPLYTWYYPNGFRSTYLKHQFLGSTEMKFLFFLLSLCLVILLFYRCWLWCPHRYKKTLKLWAFLLKKRPRFVYISIMSFAVCQFLIKNLGIKECWVGTENSWASSLATEREYCPWCVRPNSFNFDDLYLVAYLCILEPVGIFKTW